jgi:hypothetical protein
MSSSIWIATSRVWFPQQPLLEYFSFLRPLIKSCSKSTTTVREIVKLKAQRKNCQKMIEQQIWEQTEKLRFNEQEIDKLDLNISKLQTIRDNEEAMDMKCQGFESGIGEIHGIKPNWMIFCFKLIFAFQNIHSIFEGWFWFLLFLFTLFSMIPITCLCWDVFLYLPIFA